MAETKKESSKKASPKINTVDGIVIALNKLSKRVNDIEKFLEHSFRFKRKYDDD